MLGEIEDVLLLSPGGTADVRTNGGLADWESKKHEAKWRLREWRWRDSMSVVDGPRFSAPAKFDAGLPSAGLSGEKNLIVILVIFPGILERVSKRDETAKALCRDL